jgi:hypothetical protein
MSENGSLSARARRSIDAATRMAIGGGVALVDDVREGLERAQRLPLEPVDAQLSLLDGDGDGDEDDHVPGVAV